MVDFGSFYLSPYMGLSSMMQRTIIHDFLLRKLTNKLKLDRLSFYAYDVLIMDENLLKRPVSSTTQLDNMNWLWRNSRRV